MAGAGTPNLHHLLGAGSGEYLPGPDYNAMAMSEAAGTSREAPAVYQAAEFSVPRVNYVGFPLGFDAFRTPDLSSTQHIEPVGFRGASHEEDEPRIPDLELNSGTYEVAPGRQEHQQHSGETSGMDIAQEHELLIFPEGEDDAVTITGSDLECLQPERYLSNNIIDFYIKFLQRGLTAEDGERFYFFKSFFFTKLLGDSRSVAEIHESGVDFDGVRRWTREVNLFEKDYVFIPILRSSHWSLIIVSYLNGLTKSRDKRRGSPCVYHLDPIRGRHESFDDQIRRLWVMLFAVRDDLVQLQSRSRGGPLAKHVLALKRPGLCPRDATVNYMIQVCMERYGDSNDRIRIILALAREMKYVRAEVPQQGNGHDCGVYLLHYVEVFLRESTSPDFNFASTSNIWGQDFAEEASSKRWDIHSRIAELSKNTQGQLSRPMDIHPRPHPRASDAPNLYDGRVSSPKPRKHEQTKLSKKWKKEETSFLLNRMVEGDLIRKRTKPATDWDAISQDIKTELGCIRTADECRRRYDTLLKAYKKVEKTGKSFLDITEEELAKLNLATPLTDEWCRDIGTIRQRKSDTGKTRKRAKCSPDGEDEMPSANPSPPPIRSGSPAGRIQSRKQVAIPGFSSLREELRFTLLNLVQLHDLSSDHTVNYGLGNVCRMLAIVEDRKPWEIRRDIYELSKLKLVDLSRGEGWYDGEKEYVEGDRLLVFKKFVEKVVCKNPGLDIFLQLWANYDMVSLIPETPASLSLQQIRVLDLYNCGKLEEVDLSCVPELRFLSIVECKELRLVTGWEAVTKLGRLAIGNCASFVDFPPVQYLPSLRECWVYNRNSTEMDSVPNNFRQCVRLQTLDFRCIKSSAWNKMDLSMLRSLEILTLVGCDTMMSIQGLSGLHSLTTLDLLNCKGLKRVPELGCLKALTHLVMRGSGVEEIQEVQELYLLTSLDLSHCDSLKELPFLGHLKALAKLNVRRTNVGEILGVEYLVSLEILDCTFSKLKWLPDLHHLPHLQTVRVDRTPLSEMEFFSFYFGKGEVHFNSSNVDRKALLTEISDISDTE